MSNSKIKLWQFALVIFFAVSIPLTAYIITSGNFDLRISAFQSNEPRSIVISDIKDTSFRVSWITEKEVAGAVKMTDDQEIYQEFEKTSYHSVIVNNVKAGTLYQFSILSDDAEFLNSGIPYETTTAKTIVPQDDFLVYGQVFSTQGLTFQQGGIVDIALSKTDGKSQNLSAVINEAGGYQINLDSLLNASLTETYDYRDKVDVAITVYTKEDAEGLTKIFTIDLNALRQLPNVYLGDVTIDTIPGVKGE